VKDRNSRCKGQTKSGNPCRAAATEGALCFFHGNPNKAAELGQIGGRSKHPFEHSEPLPKLETAMAVRDAIAQLIADVCAGKLQPRAASCLASLLHLQLRAIETTDLERRIAKVEELLAKAEVEGDTKANGLKAA